MGLPQDDFFSHSQQCSTSLMTSSTNITGTASGQSVFKRKTLKTFESISIRRKLASFHSVFPHDDNTTVKNIAKIYDDVLEFSKPGLYSESVTRAAWKLLIPQIASRKTYHLTQALDKWPLAEVQTFLHKLADKCMTDVEEPYDSLYRKDKGDMLSSSCKEVGVLTPVLKFMAQIATQSDLACLTVLEAGILDMLLRIYIIFPALSGSLPEDVGRKLALMDACQLTVVVLCRSLDQPAVVYNHPVCILWTDRNSKRPDHPLQNRCGAWRRAPRHCAMRRLVMIYIGSLWQSNIDVVGDIEACIDIVEFTNPQFYHEEIVDLAYLAILKHIVLSGGTAQHLMNVIAECSHEDTVRVFSGVLRLWLECIGLQIKNDAIARSERQSSASVVSEEKFHSMNVPVFENVMVDQTFYDKAKGELWDKIVDVDAALIHVIQFATRAAKQNTTMRLAMLEAGSLVLALAAFANHDFKLAGLVSVPGKEEQAKRVKSGRRQNADATASCPLPLPVTAMNAGASTLLVAMRYAPFREFWGAQRFDTRLSLCSSLVDSLLGEDGDQGGSRETRALFKEIVSH